MTELICISCPKGCHLKVDEQNNYIVTGASCKKGIEYGVNELKNPKRIVTSTVAIKNATLPRCSVKTDVPIPKNKIMEVMEVLKNTSVTSPIRIGDIIIRDICSTGANIVSTRNIFR